MTAPDPSSLSDWAGYAFQLPIVAVVVWIVFKFVDVMKEERQSFLAALDRERQSREATHEKLDNTLNGLTQSVSDLNHTVTEVRRETRQAGGGGA